MFNLVSKFQPSGDQPQAIEELVKGIKEGKKNQVLLGATGTGKTFTIANVIKEVNKPTLVLAHNKTLAGQLYSEFKELFPDNAVEYFVSYYDYYQPEAYVPSTDTYIEKDAKINDEITIAEGPTREGYAFKGWCDDKEGKENCYEVGKKYHFDKAGTLTLYAQWLHLPYSIDKYIVDEVNKYIDMIDVNTSKEDFISNIKFLTDIYSVSVDTVSISGKEILYTGGKTRIYRDGVLVAEYTNIIRGDITGDGIIDYLDYVYVYNHIYKSKHPESDKLLLDGASLVAADASNDDIVDYLDYVKIYNKIKELKGGSN